MAATAQSAGTDSSSGDSDRPKEKVSLLPRATNPIAQTEGSRTRYGSDGEVESLSPRRSSSTGDARRRVPVVGEENGEQAASSAEPPSSGGAEEDGDENKCGLVYIGKKLLNLLPKIGDEEDEGTAEFEEELRFGAWQVVQLIIPVTICMAVVVVFQLTIAVNIVGPVQKPLYIPFDESSDNSGGLNFAFGLVNALVFVVIVVVMTVLLVLCFKYRCYRAIGIWLVTASGMLLFVISSVYFIEILDVRRLVIDWFSFAFIIWNFGVTGLMVIHWKGPLRLQQAYLITVSALVATVLIQHLPNWTTWILLAAISIYDLFAVLCPKGPLRVLVETAKERGTTFFPSLIYSSTMIWITMADVEDKKKNNKKSGKLPQSRPNKSRTSPTAGEDGGEEPASDGDNTDEDTDRAAAARELALRESGEHESRPRTREEQQRQEQRRQRRRQRQQQLRGARQEGEGEGEGEGQQRRGQGEGQGASQEEEEEDEPRGFKLGLGDFIFYSVLVGKAANVSDGNWVIISSCFVAILIGLCMTSLILGIVRRALPALPISILFGLVFYFASQSLIAPFIEVLNVHQVFV